MQDLQELLAPVVPAWAGLWQPVDDEEVPPPQFAVYAVQTRELAWADDAAYLVQRTVSLSLWSMSDPTAKAAEIVDAMREGGWQMVQQGVVGNGVDAATHRYSVHWTFVGPEEWV